MFFAIRPKSKKRCAWLLSLICFTGWFLSPCLFVRLLGCFFLVMLWYFVFLQPDGFVSVVIVFHFMFHAVLLYIWIFVSAFISVGSLYLLFCITSTIRACILISMLNLIGACKQQFTAIADTYSRHRRSRHRHAQRFRLPVLTRIFSACYLSLFIYLFIFCLFFIFSQCVLPVLSPPRSCWARLHRHSTLVSGVW